MKLCGKMNQRVDLSGNIVKNRLRTLQLIKHWEKRMVVFRGRKITITKNYSRKALIPI